MSKIRLDNSRLAGSSSLWRRSQQGDDDAIAAMFVALNEEDPGPALVTRSQCLHTLNTLRQEPNRGIAVVLETEDQKCGYALLVSSWSNELGGEVCTVDELYVMPSHRGNGHATKLFDLLVALWDRPHVAHALEASPANTRALALYERLGFSGSNTTLIRRL